MLDQAALQTSVGGREVGGIELAFVLSKSSLAQLTHEERTFHIFYQLSWNSAPHTSQLIWELQDS